MKRLSTSRGWTYFAVGAGLIVALLFLAALVGSLVVAFGDDSSGGAWTVVGDPTATRTAGEGSVTASDVERAFAGGLTALAADDRQAWNDALPVADESGRRALRGLFQRLAGLPLTKLSARVDASPAYPHVFKVRITGTLAGAGPRDRVLAERLLEFTARDDRAVVARDLTPEAVKRQGLMAFARPRMLRGDGVVVVYDASWKPRAEALLKLVSPARRAVSDTLGVTGERPVVLFVYSSIDQVADYLAATDIEKRIKFFSRQPQRLEPELWSPADIGVVAPELAGQEDWAPYMLAHEMTHALTMRWFRDAAHAPPLFVEGLAVAVEGGRTYEPLRRDLAQDDPRLPLLSAFAVADFWSGSGLADVTLGYLEGGAIVQYILARWGVPELRRFVVDVSSTDLTGTAVKRVVRDDLGVTWGDFYRGWKEFVETLP